MKDRAFVYGGIASLLTPAVIALCAPSAAAGPATGQCGPPADTVPPQILSISMPDKPVDVLHGAKGFDIQMHAVDASEHGQPSGIAQFSLLLLGSDRRVRHPALHLTSGTPVDGTWTAHIKLNQTVPRGTFKIVHLGVTDAAGNRTPAGEYGYAVPQGIDDTVTIEGHPYRTPTPTKPGRLISLSLQPSHVDALHHDRKVTITAGFADPQPQEVDVSLHWPSFQDLFLKHNGSGTWQATTWPRRWAGPHVVVPIDVNVDQGYQEIKAKELAARGFPHRLFINGGVDTAKPTLSALSLSQTSIDTTTQAQAINVSATITDSGTGSYRPSGIGSVTFLLSAAGNGLTWLPLQPTGQTNQYAGTYVMPTCLQSGSYAVDIQINDHAGNSIYPTADDLAAIGAPASVQVTSSPGDDIWPLVTGGTASSALGTIHVTFSEPVKDVTTSNLFVNTARYRIDVTQVTCEATDSTVTPCDGSQGGVTSAVLQTTGFAPNAELEVLGNEGSVNPQVTDLAGNPINWDCDSYQDSESDPCPDAPIMNSA